MIIDSHLHLSHKYYDQTFPYIDMDGDGYVLVPGGRIDSLITEMKQRGIVSVIEPAIDVDSNERLLRLCKETNGFVIPAVGNHPTRCIYSKLRDFKRVKQYSESEGIIAIGETGLDYHYRRREQHRLRQKIWFQWQIDLADKLDLPLILHIREADQDAISILRKNRKKLHGGVCHCFGEGPEVARIYTEELGLFLGIGGTLLMKPEISDSLKKTVFETPIEYLILETDGPYVKPQKPETISGKQWIKARNTSLILPSIARRIAELKGMSQEDVERITYENTVSAFHLERYLK